MEEAEVETVCVGERGMSKCTCFNMNVCREEMLCMHVDVWLIGGLISLSACRFMDAKHLLWQYSSVGKENVR